MKEVKKGKYIVNKKMRALGGREIFKGKIRTKKREKQIYWPRKDAGNGRPGKIKGKIRTK